MAVESLTCAGCGVEFVRPSRMGPAPMCHSVECYNLWRGYVKPALPSRVCALPECEVVFTPQEKKTRCCSERHGKMLYNREARAAGKQKQAWDDRRREHYHRRRALKKGATTGDEVVFGDIAERDGWKCQICCRSVSASRAWPHPLSPSLDHIVPLSKGGAHDPKNVRLTHLRCNISKGDRAASDQLRLIG